MEDIDAIVAAETARTGAGAAIAIIAGGAIRYARGYGLANLEWDAPTTPDTVFPIASISKPITAIAVMMLAESGALQLDDPIANYIPEARAAAYAGVTIRHLLSHTAGLAAPDPLFWTGERQRSASEADVRAYAFDHPCDAPPGARHVYSNASYTLLSFVIDAAKPEGYRRFVRDRILAPLGMTRTSLLHDRALIPRRAAGYQTGAHGIEAAHHVSFTWSRGAGGIASTVEDLAKLDAALRANTLISSDSFVEMLQPTRLNDGALFPYGLGWGVGALCGHAGHAHTGGLAGYVGEWMRFPAADVSVIVLANHASFRFHKIACAAARVAQGESPARRTALALSATEAAHIVGDYRSADGLTLSFRAEDNALRCSGAFAGRYELATENLMFDLDDPEPDWRIERALDGAVTATTYVAPFFPPLRFARVTR